MVTRATMPEAMALKAAKAGDEHAFEQLVEPYRSELTAHCYRMLSSLHDAEDALQDALIRAWKGLQRFEGRSSLRSWLYTICTNTCLNHIQRRPKRVLPIDYGPPTTAEEGPGRPLVETVWVEPFPDDNLGLTLADGHSAPEASFELRESVELAFVAALQHLAPNQRAALIMREVLGFSAKEVAEALQTSVPSVNSALQRARKTIDDKLPEQSQQATLRALGDEQLKAIVDSYMDAMSTGDVDTVVSLLTQDAAWSMPPLATWFHGPEIRDWLRTSPLNGSWTWAYRQAQTANGQPAVGAYTWDEGERAFLPFSLNVLSFEGDKISDVVSFITRSSEVPDEELTRRYPDEQPDERKVELIFARFGLPLRFAEA